MKGRHIAIVYEKLSTRGGLERYVLEFARRSMASGAHVTFVTSQIERSLDLGGAKLVRLPRSRIGLLRLLAFDRDSASAAREVGADAILGFGQTTNQDLHRAGGGCHAVYSKLLPPMKRLGIKNRIQLALERDLYCGDTTKHFVVNSSLVRRQILESYGTDPSRISVIHTPVDTNHYRPSQTGEQRRVVRSHLGIAPEEPVFLFVSLNHKRKGLHPLLRAWSSVPATLLILGDELEISHRRLLTTPALRKNVVYGGNARDLAPYYCAADFFVHPTIYDACANTVLQAMSSGLVSIVSSKDGATDHIDDGATGYLLVDPTDPAEIRDTCLRALALDADESAAIREAARERILPLTWQRHLEEWHGLINSVLPSAG
jgi:glycosyltransferase involved in cell wall biosynthesis